MNSLERSSADREEISPMSKQPTSSQSGDRIRQQHPLNPAFRQLAHLDLTESTIQMGRSP
jgi:hypothetical protein